MYEVEWKVNPRILNSWESLVGSSLKRFWDPLIDLVFSKDIMDAVKAEKIGWNYANLALNWDLKQSRGSCTEWQEVGHVLCCTMSVAWISNNSKYAMWAKTLCFREMQLFVGSVELLKESQCSSSLFNHLFLFQNMIVSGLSKCLDDYLGISFDLLRIKFFVQCFSEDTWTCSLVSAQIEIINSLLNWRSL